MVEVDLAKVSYPPLDVLARYIAIPKWRIASDCIYQHGAVWAPRSPQAFDMGSPRLSDTFAATLRLRVWQTGGLRDAIVLFCR